ncbi:1-acyl-sn-glycerol-3-phosphate acyltransferase [Formosa haliotis]|uniref:1-acyl-sn-glycerol-3-phosphate acyltransferase n=1 Tax=Formosa haliotis TaxID=1555194 RepID=UPI001147115B|nr:1-acyl-sn-glycerol-3-phosphate acyltransferase [Formosa haliotis]
MILKQIKLRVLKSYMTLGLFFYYKKISVKGSEFIPKNKAVLLLSNHQNGLLDPLIMATRLERFCYYLTRAGVFEKPWISKFLKSLNMLPVYRVRDGWQTVLNNNAIFETCKHLLSRREALVIFPEGSHNLIRKVRPLSKGFTRIVLGTLDTHPDIDLQLIPVGVNYNSPEAFADSMLLNIGAPISANRYKTLERTEAVKILKTDVETEIKELTTHIFDDYDSSLQQLEAEGADFLNPKALNHYLKHGEKGEGFKTKKTWLKPAKTSFTVVLKGMLLPVYLFWKFVAQPKIKEKEFVGTFRFALGVTLVPIWLLVLLLIIGFSWGWAIAFLSIMAILVVDLLAVKL